MSATAVAAGAAVVLVIGAVSLLGVNFSLSRGVWGETLGVPVFAAFVAFAVLQCWGWLAARLRVSTWPAWLVLAGCLALAYLIFFLVPLGYFFLGRTFVFVLLVAALAAPALLLLDLIYRSAAGQAVVQTLAVSSKSGRAAVIGGVAIAIVALGATFVVLVGRNAPTIGSPSLARPPARAAESPTVRSLALAFRPLLFFDSKEAFAPLDVDRLIHDERVLACRSVSDCDRLTTPTEINDSYSYLKLNEEVLPPGDRRAAIHSAIYYHFSGHGDQAFLDYWWYFSFNPSPEAQALLCGPGTVWIGVVCGNHPSDWEGVTVILSRCTGAAASCVTFDRQTSYQAVRIRYGQHESDAPFDWSDLQKRWNELAARVPSAPWSRVALGNRPLAFVALKSHATYEKPCGDALRSLPKRLVAYCPQTLRPALTERRDGRQPWIDNECQDCLKPLPVTQSDEPTDWNAFSGHWGERICILGGAFCTTGEPPRGPSQHDRYTNPGGTSNASD